MKEKLIILIPVYNDAESLNVLINRISEIILQQGITDFTFFIVDDGSVFPQKIMSSYPLQILHLQRNIGHQKALAIGLAYIKDHFRCDKVLIMDSDGEDRPEDFPLLYSASVKHPEKIIFAYRQSRQNGMNFNFFYRLYKLLFRLLTGKKISFGNFLIMPKASLDKIVFYSEIWNHLAGGILKSGLPFTSVKTHRGKRYADKSKMTFTSLLLHGLGAIAVFVEVIATRLLILSFILIGISILAILLLIGIRTFTSLAIPGWTSNVVSAMLIILLQGFLLSLFTIFLYLSSQSQRKFIPANHYEDYTGAAETVK
jgi:glycosyltransferase involved in cell wall biosynthesis